MEITIFKEVTTEGVISSIEENSKKYHEGFYADMNNAPERKLVKESAADINNMIKDLKSARIRITKENTAKVNKEHDAIVERLAAANLPFTVLIDEYNIERKRVLDEEKRVVALKAAMIQKEEDHEMALLINKTFEFDKAEAIRIADEQIAEMEEGARIRAEENQRLENERIEQRKVSEENARLANVEHVRSVNVAILNSMISHGLPEAESKKFIATLARKELNQLTINY